MRAFLLLLPPPFFFKWLPDTFFKTNCLAFFQNFFVVANIGTVYPFFLFTKNPLNKKQKLKKEAASKKEKAGGDANHVSFFTWPKVGEKSHPIHALPA